MTLDTNLSLLMTLAILSGFALIVLGAVWLGKRMAKSGDSNNGPAPANANPIVSPAPPPRKK